MLRSEQNPHTHHFSKSIDQHRKDLAILFRIFGYKQWDNWTYTHLSCRLDDTTFLINPFGILYQDMTPDCLVLVDMNQPLEQYFGLVNPTGVLLHRALYQNRPDVNAAVHLHTPHGVATSAMACGLLPISQYALHFYNRVSLHSYDSLILDEKEQCQKVAQDLGDNFAMLLQNHGTLTVGRSVEEAFFFTHHLEEACRVQCLVLAAGKPYIDIPEIICEKAYHDLLSFEENRGIRDFKAARQLLAPSVRAAFGLE